MFFFIFLTAKYSYFARRVWFEILKRIQLTYPINVPKLFETGTFHYRSLNLNNLSHLKTFKSDNIHLRRILLALFA